MIEQISSIASKTVERSDFEDYQAITIKSLITITERINELIATVNWLESKEIQREQEKEEYSKMLKNTRLCIMPEEASSVAFYKHSFGEWIPAEDTLPSTNKEVFVAVYNRKLKIYDLCISSLVEYNQCVDWANLEGYDKSVWSVTHWMPLPELPPIERTEK